jgi:uncharacterized membrane protein
MCRSTLCRGRSQRPNHLKIKSQSTIIAVVISKCLFLFVSIFLELFYLEEADSIGRQRPRKEKEARRTHRAANH